MPPLEPTNLPARAQNVITALIVTLAVMGASPLFDIAVFRWPLHFSEVTWRFRTFEMLLTNGPQIVILVSVIVAVGILASNRIAVRVASVVLSVTAIIFIPLLLFYLLDFLQVRRQVPQANKQLFDGTAAKTAIYTILVIATAGWVGLRGWQSSFKAHRVKAHRLVVGQDGESGHDE